MGRLFYFNYKVLKFYLTLVCYFSFFFTLSNNSLICILKTRKTLESLGARLPEINEVDTPDFKLNSVHRITAMWALSEAALGGVLHALRIPLTGLFIGGSAVIFITLIAVFTTKRGAILKATLIIMIIKALVSPHSPLPAYFAIAFQGILGEILFRFIGVQKLAAFILGVLALLQSAFQKLIVLTLIFGQNLWESIDLFSNYVLSQFLVNNQEISYSISMILISVYVIAHLVGGIVAGLWAPVIASAVKGGINQTTKINLLRLSSIDKIDVPQKKRKHWWNKKSLIIFMIIALSIFILSYFFPVFEKSKGLAALFMIIRSIIIMLLWYILLAPFLMGKLQFFLNNKKIVYAAEITTIINLFPLLKLIIKNSWQDSINFKNIKRINNFVVVTLLHLLTIDFGKDYSQES